MSTHAYMRAYILIEAVEDPALNYGTAYDFLARIHVLDYIYSRMVSLDRALAAKIDRILREMFEAAKVKIKEMYGGKMANFFTTHTPEEDKKKAISIFISQRCERGKLTNLVDHLSFDDTSGQVMFNNVLPLDMRYFRGMEGLAPRDVAVALLLLKPMDWKREAELEELFKDQYYDLSSWRTSRLEDVEYAVRKQLENMSWAGIADVLLGNNPYSSPGDRKMESGLVKMYEEILGWMPFRDSISKQRSLMTRALQHAHHAEPVMATKIGLDEQDLKNLNYIEVLPPGEHEDRERHYRRLGRGHRDMGEREWLIQLARKHGVEL